jgi:hypothetical protein
MAKTDLPFAIIGLMIVALTFCVPWVPLDAIGISGTVAFIASVIWASV